MKKRRDDREQTPVTLEWLQKHEWGSDEYAPVLAEAKRWKRGKICFMMARAYVRAREEREWTEWWPLFDELLAPEDQQYIVDFFAPPPPPTVMRFIEGGRALMGDRVIIPTPKGFQTINFDEYIRAEFLIHRHAPDHTLQHDFLVVLPPELAHRKTMRWVITRDPSWLPVKLIDKGYFKLFTDDELQDDSLQSQRRRAMRDAARCADAWTWGSELLPSNLKGFRSAGGHTSSPLKSVPYERNAGRVIFGA
jgi:hypothetical protein